MNSLDTEFERTGYVGPLDILTPQEARLALEQVLEELSLPNSNRFKLHLVLPCLNSISRHPKLVEAVQAVLKTPDVLLWSSDVNLKPAGSPSFFAPHQDGTYAGLSPPSKCLTAWVALSDPVGEQEGCLSFYSASHMQRQLRHERNASDDNALSLGQYIPNSCLDERFAGVPPKPIPLRGGQGTLHSFTNVHFSGPNQSGEFPRVGFALRFMAADVVQTKPIKEMATWISGRKDISHFDFEPVLPQNATKEDLERGQHAREEAMRREEENYFAGSNQSKYKMNGVEPRVR